MSHGYGHLGEDKLLGLVLGMAGELEAERMEPHLRECADCQAKVAELEREQKVMSALFGAPAGAPPRGLAKRVRKRIFQRPLRLRVSLPRLVAAAAVLIAVAAGVYLLPVQSPRAQMLEVVRFSEARALGLSGGEGR